MFSISILLITFFIPTQKESFLNSFPMQYFGKYVIYFIL